MIVGRNYAARASIGELSQSAAALAAAVFKRVVGVDDRRHHRTYVVVIRCNPKGVPKLYALNDNMPSSFRSLQDPDCHLVGAYSMRVKNHPICAADIEADILEAARLLLGKYPSTVAELLCG